MIDLLAFIPLTTLLYSKEYNLYYTRLQSLLLGFRNCRAKPEIGNASAGHIHRGRPSFSVSASRSYRALVLMSLVVSRCTENKQPTTSGVIWGVGKVGICPCLILKATQ